MPAHPEFLTIPEAAEPLRISERTTYQLVRDGELPAIKVGGQWRVHRETPIEWAKKGGRMPAVPKKAKRTG